MDEVGVETIETRVRCLTGWLLETMPTLRHANGAPLVRVHGPKGPDARGGTVSFTLLDPDGTAFDVDVAVAASVTAGGVPSLRRPASRHRHDGDRRRPSRPVRRDGRALPNIRLPGDRVAPPRADRDRGVSHRDLPGSVRSGCRDRCIRRFPAGCRGPRSRLCPVVARAAPVRRQSACTHHQPPPRSLARSVFTHRSRPFGDRCTRKTPPPAWPLSWKPRLPPGVRFTARIG